MSVFCFNVGKNRIVDLSYNLDSSTIFWPGGEGFNLCMRSGSDPETGLFYSAGVFRCAEHGGTHVDAPYHFAEAGITVDQIPISSLVAPCRVIDVTVECRITGSDFELLPEHIMRHEAEHGTLEKGMIILIRFGWSQNYLLGAKAYLGFDETIDGPYDPKVSALSFPGISTESANLLVAREIAGVGLDTGACCSFSSFSPLILLVPCAASLDPGSSKDFASHRILLGNNIFGIENINGSIAEVPEVGSVIFVMPLKLSGGSGSPARVCVAIPEA